MSLALVKNLILIYYTIDIKTQVQHFKQIYIFIIVYLIDESIKHFFFKLYQNYFKT